jgi:hypothetical protein
MNRLLKLLLIIVLSFFRFLKMTEIHLCVLDMSNSKCNNNGSQSTHPALVDSADLKVNSEPYAMEIIWRNVFVYIYLHATALYGFYLCFTDAKLSTLIWSKLNLK